MSRGVVIEAPAKINLNLAVLDRRPDGFHDILSIFQAVSLCDTLEIRRKPSGGVSLEGEFDCPPDKNTIVRAARSFLDTAGLGDGLEIRVEKRIPAGAGLGGGSSDAASTLSALNRIYGFPLSEEELSDMGAAVGSDVPFFLGGACAIVSGRGERVEPFEGRTDFSVVVLFPGFSISTAQAYAAVDESRAATVRRSSFVGRQSVSSEWLRREYGKNPGLWRFRNDFQEALAPKNPEFGQAYTALVEAGADYASLTGSGSAFFGIFRSAATAREAARTLNALRGGPDRWSSVVAAPLACMPSPRLQ